MQQDPKPVALVLGAAVWPVGRASPTLRRRARHAAMLYHAGRIGHVIGCGGVGRHPPSEARVIRDICMAEGVPGRAITEEDRSTNTVENLTFAQQVMGDIGVTEAVIVTDRYHARRARLIARHLGLPAISDCPAPAGLPWPKRLRYTLREAGALPLAALRLWLSG